MDNYVCIEGGLKYFFEHAIITIHDKNNNISLNALDFFPELKQGYAEYSTIQNILFFYCSTNDLVHDVFKVKLDSLLNAALNGTVSSTYYLHTTSDNKRSKIKMDDAVISRFTRSTLNTLQCIRSLNGFNTFDIRNIIDINTSPCSQEKLPELGQKLHNEMKFSSILCGGSLDIYSLLKIYLKMFDVLSIESCRFFQDERFNKLMSLVNDTIT